MTEPLRIFIVAGEASGDALGASLMGGLKALHPDIEFRGVGGPQMEAEGMQSLFPMHELSVMGIAEVLPSLFKILSRMKQTVKAALDFRPHAVITVDSPDFCFRVAKKIRAKSPSARVAGEGRGPSLLGDGKGEGLSCLPGPGQSLTLPPAAGPSLSRHTPGEGIPKFIHYVAPSVWAWRPGRAKKVAGFLDHILTLLPFEPKYFTAHGLGATFVGHPIVERMDQRGDGARFRRKHGLKPTQPVLCMLPGSRTTELDRLLDKFSGTADIVLRNRHDAVIVIPTLPHLKARIEKFFVGRGINPIVCDAAAEKFDAFAASTAAIAASGTVTLELALCDTPHIIAYKLGTVSAWIAKQVVRTPYVNLINIILQRPVVPELLLENCEPGPMSKALIRLMDDRDARAAQLTAFREALIALGLGDPETPGQKAARAVLDVVSLKPLN